MRLLAAISFSARPVDRSSHAGSCGPSPSGTAQCRPVCERCRGILRHHRSSQTCSTMSLWYAGSRRKNSSSSHTRQVISGPEPGITAGSMSWLCNRASRCTDICCATRGCRCRNRPPPCRLPREVPGLIVDSPDGAAQWVDRTRAALNAAGHVVTSPQLLVAVDRNPAVQQMRIILARPSRTGRASAAPGYPPDRPSRLLPDAPDVFLNTDAILDWRAEGTFNPQHIRGLGLKGMRVWDFGWQTRRARVGAGGESEIRLLVHATDPDYLERRHGRPASKGCVRISAAMSCFLDRHGVLDADYGRGAKIDDRFAALLLPDRVPTPLAGNALVIINSAKTSAADFGGVATRSNSGCGRSAIRGAADQMANLSSRYRSF